MHGREFDSLARLHNYRARFHDSNLGRFISEDPNGFDEKRKAYEESVNRTRIRRFPFYLVSNTELGGFKILLQMRKEFLAVGAVDYAVIVG
jgi:hypothetical protein